MSRTIPALVLSVTAAASAWLAGAAAQQPPFKASADLVVVDVSVLGRDGSPARGLQAGDFVVKVDGRPRKVASVQLIEASRWAAAGAAAPAAGTAAGTSRYSSNEGAISAGRLVVIVVDEASIPAGGLREASASIGKLLDGLGEQDRIAVVALPGPKTLVDFTSDRKQVAEGLQRVSGGASWAGASGSYQISVLEAFAIGRGDQRVYDAVVGRECSKFYSDLDKERCPQAVKAEARRIVNEAGSRTRLFTTGFGSLIETLGRTDVPKVVVLFSEGLPSPEAPTSLQQLAPAIAEARAVVHVMRIDRGVPGADRTLPSAGDDRTAVTSSLHAIAGAGRGGVFDVAESGDQAFQRLAAELSAHYLLGVEPDAGDRDGKAHRIDVSIGKPGLTVRARPVFVIGAAPSDEMEYLERSLRSPLPSVEVPVRLTAFSLADEDPKLVRVFVAGEVDRQQQAGGSALVGFVLRNEANAPVGSFARRMDLPKAPSSDRLSFVGGVSVPPGRYTVKLAVVRNGRAGSVEHAIDARLVTAGGLRIGHLVMSEPPLPDGMLAPAVDGRLHGDRIVALLHLGHEPGVKPELAIDIVQQEDGPALLTVPFQLQSSGSRATAVQVNVDAHLLPPGGYIARLDLSKAGAETKVVAPFSLERLPGAAGAPSLAAAPPTSAGRPPATPAGAAKPPAPPRPVRFRTEDVLDTAVLNPFLDQLAVLASPDSRPAIEHARAGRLDEALSGLKAGSLTDPAEPFIRGLSLLSKGQVQPASEAFRDAVRVSPEFLVGAFYLGACYAAGGRTTQAINAWQTSLIGLGRFPAVYRFLGDALMQSGESERGLAILAKAAAKWPDDVRLGTLAMEAMLEAGRLQDALALADRVLEQQAANPDLLFTAMQAAFLAALRDPAQPIEPLRARLERWQEQYVAAGGSRQALVQAWVAFVRGMAERRSHV